MEEKNRPRLGKYELLARLATGGMAELFLGRVSAIGGFSRVVVLKRILPHLADQMRFVEMFLEEARLASRIHHPNVVQILDVDQDQGSFFIVMEYIDGVSLSAMCRRIRESGRPLLLNVASEIISQACDGLHAAHDLRDEGEHLLGLVHRDVSPQNLMISRSGVVKLVDFGIAKAKDTAARTNPGSVKGKTHYMSPEQVRAEALDRRSDIFSLGTIFFEMLCARRLFAADSEMAAWRAITEERIPRPREVCPDIPEQIEDIIVQALSRDREARFDDADQMGTALRDAMKNLNTWTSPRTVADYVHEHCQDMLVARSLGTISQLSTLSSSLPRLEGFEEGEETLPDNRTALTRPGKFLSSRRPPQLEAIPRGESVPPPRDTQVPRAPRWRRSRLLMIVVPFLLVTALAGAGLLLLRSATTVHGPPLYFAHPPTYSKEITTQGWAPLTSYLEKRLDRPVEVVVTKDYTALREELRRGKVHLANLSPLLFVQARLDTPPPNPLASNTYEGSRTYQAYLVTRDDSDIHAIGDLRGHTFCYVDRASTSGYLLPRHFLRSQGLDPNTLFSKIHFSGRHEVVLRDIIEGRCDAGAVYSNAFMSASTLGVASSRLRMLTVAGDTPWDVICASPQLPTREAAAIKRAFLEFRPNRDIGQKILSPIFRLDGFVEPRLEDFADLERAARAEGLL